jgi:hypothetical protein
LKSGQADEVDESELLVDFDKKDEVLEDKKYSEYNKYKIKPRRKQ